VNLKQSIEQLKLEKEKEEKEMKDEIKKLQKEKLALKESLSKS
jgi:hypothetical protein